VKAWADGVRLAECSREVAAFFAALGFSKYERRALDLRARIVTRMLGSCHAHVGRAMLDSARCALRAGDTDRATSLCNSVVADFAHLVDDGERAEDRCFDEHRLALEHLLAALDLLTLIGKAAPDAAPLLSAPRTLARGPGVTRWTEACRVSSLPRLAE
jgi:hypothetical protein